MSANSSGSLILLQIRQVADAWAFNTGKDQLLAIRQAEYWFDSRRYVKRRSEDLLAYLTAVFDSEDPEGARPAPLKRGPKRVRPLLHFPYAIRKRPEIDAGEIILGDTVAEIDPNDPPLFDLEPVSKAIQPAGHLKKILDRAKIRHELCIRLVEYLETMDAPTTLHREQIDAVKNVLLRQSDFAVSRAMLYGRRLATAR